jgi:hypothetical protein
MTIWAMQNTLRITGYRRLAIGGLELVTPASAGDVIMVDLAGAEPVTFEMPAERARCEQYLTAITTAYGLGRADLQSELAALCGFTLIKQPPRLPQRKGQS